MQLRYKLNDLEKNLNNERSKCKVELSFYEKIINNYMLSNTILYDLEINILNLL